MDPARKRDGREVDQDGAIAKNFESFQRSKVQKALTSIRHWLDPS
jgi:hypothetical protein